MEDGSGPWGSVSRTQRGGGLSRAPLVAHQPERRPNHATVTGRIPQSSVLSPQSFWALALCVSVAVGGWIGNAVGEDLPRFRFTDLGDLCGGCLYEGSRAFGVNNAGQVVGYSMYEYESQEAAKRAFLWLPEPAFGFPAGMQNLGMLPGQPEWKNSSATAINAAGRIVGTSASDGFIWVPEAFAGLPAKTMSALPTFVEDGDCTPAALDDEDDPLTVVGWAVYGECGDVQEPISEYRGFIWRTDNQGELTELPPPPPPGGEDDWTDTKAFGLNSAPGSRIVGRTGYCGDSGGGGCGDLVSAAPAWTGTTPTALDMTAFGDIEGEGRDVNDAGEIVGWANDVNHVCRSRAVYWADSESDLTDLHTESGMDVEHKTVANAINSQQEIVGWNESTSEAILWEPDGSGGWTHTNLDALIREQMVGGDEQHEWAFFQAFDINDAGWIVGWGVRPYEGGVNTAFLVTPTEGDCLGDIVPDGTVDVLDLLEVLSQWGCSTGQICTADVAGPDAEEGEVFDGIVDVQDLLKILSIWGPCGSAAQPIPRNVQDCIDRFGYDPIPLKACLDAIGAGE